MGNVPTVHPELKPGYAVRLVLTGTRSGIKVFLLKKEQSQQITLFQYFGIGDLG